MSVLKYYNTSTSQWEAVVVGAVGPTGPAGPAGPAGPEGPPRSVGGSYTHTQGVATTTWTITHNLGYKPAVTTFDSLNQEVEGDLVHISTNQCSVTFSYPISGSASLS